jgi:hypothetical protein
LFLSSLLQQIPPLSPAKRDTAMPSGVDQPTTSSGRYLVGIDLGTTNSALAHVDLKKRGHEGRPDMRDCRRPQLVLPPWESS